MVVVRFENSWWLSFKQDIPMLLHIVFYSDTPARI